MLIVTQRTKRKEERNERKNNLLDIFSNFNNIFDMYSRHQHEFYNNNHLELKKIHHRVEYLKIILIIGIKYVSLMKECKMFPKINIYIKLKNVRKNKSIYSGRKKY